eukprot:488002_1
MAESKFKETQSDDDDYSDNENAKKHDYELDTDWDGKTKTITLTVTDAISNKKWQRKLGKLHYAKPSTEYDKIVKVVNDETVSFDCYLSKKSGDLMVTFTKNGNNIYEWVFDECK